MAALGFASFTLRRNGYIERCNEAARELLAALPAQCHRFGHLRSLGERSHPPLPEALALCRPGHPVQIASHVAVPKPRVLTATLQCPEDVGDTADGAGRSPEFLLVVELPLFRRDGLTRSLASLFDLTRAEVRVLAGVLQGWPADAIAAQAGTTLPTVRSQIRSLLAKTGASSQIELVLLLRSVRF